MATYQGWLTINPTSGSGGETNINVYALENRYPFEREVSFKAYTDTQSVNFTVKQAAASVTANTFLTCYYNVTSTTENTLILSERVWGWSNNFLGMKVNNGSLEMAVNSYRFQRLGTNKVEYLFRNDAIISGDSFNNVVSLTSVTIPNSVTGIENNSFRGCIGLGEIVLPASVTTLGINVFADCSSLSSVTLTTSLTSIPGGAFWNCTRLNNVIIPSSITNIGTAAFLNCRGLTKIYAYPVIAPTIENEAALDFPGLNGVLHYPAGSDYSSWLEILDDWGWTGVADL